MGELWTKSASTIDITNSNTTIQAIDRWAATAMMLSAITWVAPVYSSDSPIGMSAASKLIPKCSCIFRPRTGISLEKQDVIHL